MRKTLSTVILVFLSFIALFAQNDGHKFINNWEKYISLEAGYIYPEGKIKESLSIRQNINYYYSEYYSGGYIESQTSGLILGLRYELYSPGLKSGISGGLRFTGLNTEICGYTSSSSDFFYLRYSMEDSDTKFARVKELTERNYVISIPLEIRSPSMDYRTLSLFARAGLEYSIISLKKDTDIKFQDDAMMIHKSGILKNISGYAGKSYSTFYTSIGLKLGKEDRLNYIMDIYLPSLFLTKNNFYFIDAKFFTGFKLSLLIPINNK